LVLDGRGTSEETYLRSLEISSRTLTAYILYRDLIIKKLGEITASDKESAVHELIVPRYQQIESSAFHDHLYKNNIWLLDDKFMSFRTILSERKMRDLISVISPDKAPPESDGRPDIALVFSADPESTEKVDVVVIELKPRKADEKENNFATVQLVNRANMLVDYCPNIQRVWYFAILEIDAQQARTFQSLGFQPLFPRIKSSIKN
jgi:hypothetical protein